MTMLFRLVTGRSGVGGLLEGSGERGTGDECRCGVGEMRTLAHVHTQEFKK